MSFLDELKRRNVFRVGIAYAVAAWLLLQVLDVVGEILELPAWGGKLILAIIVAGFFVTLFVAWAFELTPEGIKRESEVDRSQSITAQTGRRLDRAIIVVLALALAYFVADKFLIGLGEPRPKSATAAPAPEPAPGSVEAAGRKSIAVLPFANRSPNPNDAFFADGVHDDLLTHLSKIGDLHVISRTSVMGYAGTGKKMSEIGKELGVTTVMEGAVQRAGNRVRINVQLIDAPSDAHLWAEIYDRELTTDNIFDIQSEITKAIAIALDAVLSTAEQQELHKRPTQNLAAYDAYLQGRLQLDRFFITDSAYPEAVAQFDKAIALDPAFGEAWAEKAYTQLALHWFNFVDGDWLPQAEQSLAKAEALAPDAVETLTARGYYHYWGHLDFAAADAAFDRALERSPNYVKAIVGKAYAARRDGRFEEALTLLLMGRRLDPLNIDTHSSVVETLIGLGRFDEALAALDRARETGQAMAIDPTITSWLWESLGDAERAWQAVADATDSTRVLFFQTRSYSAQRTRDAERIRLALETWPEELRRPATAPEAYELQRARSLLVLGDTAQAREVLVAVKARIDAADDPYPEGWNANALYLPVDLPGLLGDTAGVRAAVADWEANHRPDAWDEQFIRWSFAEAYANAGDAEAALDQIELLASVGGPWVYPALSINPALDSLREHPRYQALKEKYEALH